MKAAPLAAPCVPRADIGGRWLCSPSPALPTVGRLSCRSGHCAGHPPRRTPPPFTARSPPPGPPGFRGESAAPLSRLLACLGVWLFVAAVGDDPLGGRVADSGRCAHEAVEVAGGPLADGYQRRNPCLARV